MLASGTQLGRYEIAAPLGAGGMGEVYRANDSRLERQVAIKVLPPQFVQDQARLARFEREAKVVAALSHPNILGIHDFVTEQGQTFAVMELLEGETLRGRVAHGPIPWKRAVEIAVAIAEGLAAAHAKGIIHRDLKPENIFLTADGRVKILDFGLARIKPASPSGDSPTGTYHPDQTEAGVILGTVGYMSPEQVRGQEADGKSDIFSLGCLFHEMVTGQRAFAQKSAAETMAAILHTEPPEVADSGQKVPLELERVIRRCLEKNPEERFESARDLAFALRSLASDPNLGQAGAAPGRFRTVASAAAGVVLVGLLAAVVALLLRRDLRPEGSTAPAAPAPRIDSVAVLPLVVRGDYPRGEALSEGVPRTLIRNLLEVPSLKVAPFSSVAHYAQKSGVDLRDVGRQLEVAAVLAGRISPGEQAHVLTVELMDVHQNRSLWLQEYDLRQDLLFIQDDILKELAARLGWQLSAEQKARLARRPTQDTAAYLEYLEGQYAARQWTVSGIKQGIDRLERAVARDPSFALAHAALAEAYIVSAHIIMQPKAALEKARQAAEEAIRRDRALAEGHNALAVVKMCADWDWAGAEKAFQEALRLNPNCAIVHDWYGWYWNSLGQIEKAVAQMEKALELEPRSSLYNVDLAYIYLNARRYDDAARQARKALALDPQDGQAPEVLAAVYVLRDRDYPAAVRELEALVKRDERPNRYTQLGWVYGRWQKRPEALRMLQRLDGMGTDWHIQAFERAEIYASLEDKDQAFQYLDQTLEERSPAILYLKLSPVWDPLRDDPRFDALLRRIGVADEPERKDEPIDTLAVLPFDNQSPDPEAGYLGDDITYSLTDSLMRVRELIVRPYGSASKYKPGSFDAKTAGRELQAQAVLRGSIQKRGDEILIEVELMHVGENRRLWGKHYPPARLADRLALQQQIIQEVPEQLRLTLTSQEKQVLAKLPTQSLKAHELYILGRLEWNKRTRSALEKSIDLFRQAAELDPNYALAWAGLADAYFVSARNTNSPPHDFTSQAKTTAAKALEIDSQLAEAHTTLAAIASCYDWDWSEAERRFQRALALNPHYATARSWFGHHLAALGRFDEAQAQFQRAQELDPLSPNIHAMAGKCLYFARQYDAAIAQHQATLAIDPSFWLTHIYLGQAYAQKGRDEDAIAELQKARKLSGDALDGLATLGCIYAAMGKTAEARQVQGELRELSQQRYVAPYNFAVIHAALGEKDQACSWLQKAYEDRNRLMMFLKVEPMFDSLKGDPRFQKIIADMKFPQ